MSGKHGMEFQLDELSAIRESLERAIAENSHAHEEIEAMLAELHSLKQSRTSGPGKSRL